MFERNFHKAEKSRFIFGREQNFGFRADYFRGVWSREASTGLR